MILYRLLSFHLALLLFCSQVYVPVYSHVCHGMGKSWSAMWVKPDSCCKKSSKQIDLPVCRKESASDQAVTWQKLPCCENQSTCLGMMVHFVKNSPLKENHGKTIAKPSPHLVPISISSFQFFQVSDFVPFHGPPLYRSVKTMLILHQTWLC